MDLLTFKFHRPTTPARGGCVERAFAEHFLWAFVRSANFQGGMTQSLSQITLVQIHWYRRQKNASNWQLVGTVDEVSYKLTSADLGSTVMAVIAMQPDGKGVIRQESNVMGPIKE